MNSYIGEKVCEKGVVVMTLAIEKMEFVPFFFLK